LQRISICTRICADRVRFVWLITCGVLLTRVVHADGTEADRLFEEGRALAKGGHYAEACDRFAKSLAIERTIGTELNLADCHQQLGHLREAWGMFIAAQADAQADGDAKRATFARERATALEPKMTTMVVRVAQPALPGLVLTIAGRTTPPALEIHEHADPGEIDVIATAPGVPTVKRTATGAAGATVVVEIPALDTSVHRVPPAVATEGPRERGRVRLAYGFGAGGIASAITAATLTWVGHSHYRTAVDGPHCSSVTGGVSCDDIGTKAIHDAQHLADIGTGFAVASGALIGTAAILYFTAPREKIFVHPQASAQTVGVIVGGSF